MGVRLSQGKERTSYNDEQYEKETPLYSSSPSFLSPGIFIIKAAGEYSGFMVFKQQDTGDCACDYQF
ncbi:hypothetical protein L1987_73281 [Smallanthus sonchifolius]|uniref:Uncharacterized protein n=1 Tax=Smallanthus sonchifolius TaxID=185202 RepID=A0ACB9A4J7_9ASTR|nr:hypothetical protein L1987_73281 [Smallanthus sonchifolius]